MSGKSKAPAKRKTVTPQRKLPGSVRENFVVGGWGTNSSKEAAYRAKQRQYSQFLHGDAIKYRDNFMLAEKNIDNTARVLSHVKEDLVKNKGMAPGFVNDMFSQVDQYMPQPLSSYPSTMATARNNLPDYDSIRGGKTGRPYKERKSLAKRGGLPAKPKAAPSSPEKKREYSGPNTIAKIIPQVMVNGKPHKDVAVYERKGFQSQM